MSLTPVLRSWDIVALAVVLSLLNYGFRILRWRAYLARLGHSLTFRFCALTYIAGFAYTLSPGKVGEMVRARYYVPLGIRLSDVAAAFFAERLLDLVAMVILATLFTAAIASYGGILAAVALTLTLVLIALAFVPWAAVAAKLKSWPRLPVMLRSPLLGITSALVSTRPLLRPAMLAGGFLLALLAWGSEGAGLGLLSSILPAQHLSVATAVGIYGIAVLVGGISFLPGGLGSTEAVMTALLVTQGYSISDALLLTLTCRLVTLWFAVGLGWVAVLLLRQRPVTAAVT
jgi:uncharacterized membrane protein YbhN (UPF0104 family)